MKKPTFLLLGGLVSGLLACGSVHANDGTRESQFMPFKGDGFYWYAKPPVEPLPPASSPVRPAAPESPKKVEPLSMKWLSDNLQPLLQKAADSPSRDNVANYFYAQRILLDKSQNFSTAAGELIASDPYLDENNRVPIAQFANLEFERQSKKDQESILKLLTNRGGIWLFTDRADRCAACKTFEKDIIVGDTNAGIAKEFGFSYRVIDVSTKKGKFIAQKLKLKVTPTTVFVSPPNKFVLLSQGLMSLEALKTRIVVGARVAGLLSPQEASLSLPYDKNILKNEDIEMETEGKDASDVMKSFRERIQSR